MHTLHAKIVENLASPKDLLTAVKAVGRAHQMIDVPNDPSAIRARLREESNPILLGAHEDLACIQAAEAELDASGVLLGLVDYDPSAEPEEQEGLEEVPPDDDPEPPYQFAMVLLQQAKGNPLEAAVNAHNLANVAEDADQYWGAVGVFIECFPWIVPALAKTGILSEEDE